MSHFVSLNFFFIPRNVVVVNDSTKAVIHRLKERLTSVKEKPAPEKTIPMQEENENDEDTKIISMRKRLRTGIILRAVKSNRIMTVSQIYNQVKEEEKQQKIKHVMDRKSLKRILEQIVKEGLLKTHSDAKTQYFCDLSYDASQKSDENFTVDHYIQRFLDESEKEFKKAVPNKNGPEKLKKKIKGVLRTYTPKFLRLSVLHDVLFYLVRDYTGDTDSSHEELLSRLEPNCNVDEELRKEMPRLYMDHVSCYMFTPPLSALHGNCLFDGFIFLE